MIINKWLNGEEDEDYEVKPLAKEGKFSVRKRKKQESASQLLSEDESDEEKPQGPVTPEPASSCELRTKSAEHNEEEPAKKETSKAKPKVKSEVPKPKSKQKKDPELSNILKSNAKTNEEILNHLRLLGDDILERRMRRESRRNVKYELAKRLPQQVEEVEPEEHVVYVPRYIRQRVVF
jgi:hypothetical protein